MDLNAEEIKPGTPWATVWKGRDFWATRQPGDHFLTPARACGAIIDSKISAIMNELKLNALLEIGPGDSPSHVPAQSHLAVDRRPTPGIDMSLISHWDTETGEWEPDISKSWGNEPLFALAIEFLDDIPCTVAHRLTSGIYHQCPIGSSNHVVSDNDLEWAERWWPEGDSLDIGRTRDTAWKWLVEHLPAGSAIAMIDYGHVRAGRPSGSTLAAHRDGHAVDPADHGGNLTAHVAVDAVAAAGEAGGARTVELARLSEVDWPLPPAEGLEAIALRSQHALLTDPGRFGDFWWLLQVIDGRGGDNGGRA